MADTMAGLFGPTPEEVRAAQMQAYQQQAQQYGRMDPFQQANTGMFTSGARIGDLIARATGGVNVAQQRAAQQQEAMQNADLQTPEGLRAAAKKMLDMGNQKSAYLLSQKAAELEKSVAEEKYKAAQTAQQEAMAKKLLAEATVKEKEDGLKNLPPEVQAMLKLQTMDPSSPGYTQLKSWLDKKMEGKGDWSEPFNLAGATVQKNLQTGEIRTAVARPPVTHVNAGGSKASTELGKLKSDLDSGFITKEQYDAAVAKATAIGGKATIDDQKKVLNTLKSAGYDPTTGEDAISNLIKKSTSGGLEQMGVDTLAFFGQSTEGSQAINTLAAASNTIVMDMMGGKLGAGVSNADRDFIVGQLGDVANPKKPIADRLAAWNFARARMINAGLLPESANKPQAPPGTPSPKPSTPKRYKFDAQGNMVQ